MNQAQPPSTSPRQRGKGNNPNITLLPPGFSPGKDDVICGRGKKCYSHIGNDRFRMRVMEMLGEYARAKSKLDKSGVLAALVEKVRLASPEGGFVKEDGNGRWYEVGDFLAREKTSQAFRDALHEHYKSSNVAKKKKRQEEYAKSEAYSGNRAKSVMRRTLSLEPSYTPQYPQSSRMQNHSFYYNHNDMAARLSRVPEMRFPHSRFTAPRPTPSNSFIYNTPDPLFGANFTNTANTTLRPFKNPLAYELLHPDPASPGFPDPRRRSNSLDLLPPEGARLERSELGAATEDLHHSVPLLQMTEDEGGGQPLHQSMPDIHFEREDPDQSTTQYFDPLPFAVDEQYHSTYASRAQSQHIPPHTASSTSTYSKNLVSCLEKFTEHSISDANPFEPIPFVNPLLSTAAAATTLPEEQRPFQSIADPSEGDETCSFAEG